MEKKQGLHRKGITYSSLAIINKEELHGELQVFKRGVLQEKNVMKEKQQQPSIFARHKDTMETG